MRTTVAEWARQGAQVTNTTFRFKVSMLMLPEALTGGVRSGAGRKVATLWRGMVAPHDDETEAAQPRVIAASPAGCIGAQLQLCAATAEGALALTMSLPTELNACAMARPCMSSCSTGRVA